MYTSADAVDRETAWLRTSGDGLPALLEEAGGPFEVIQGYITRTPATEARCLYVTRRRLTSVRIGAPRQQNKNQMRLWIWWPATDGDGQVENDQRALDVAVDAVVTRVGGFLGDKTHGGRFLDVAEDGNTDCDFGDPRITLGQLGAFTVDITYTANDVETIG